MKIRFRTDGMEALRDREWRAKYKKRLLRMITSWLKAKRPHAMIFERPHNHLFYVTTWFQVTPSKRTDAHPYPYIIIQIYGDRTRLISEQHVFLTED